MEKERRLDKDSVNASGLYLHHKDVRFNPLYSWNPYFRKRWRPR